jgi:general secretion pathway protein A
MYQSHFGLVEPPFSIAPDPHYLYMSEHHQEALATLLFGVSGDGGFVLLTGEVGAGKTTICRYLLEQVPEACDLAYIFNPKLTVVELLSTICDEFGIKYPKGNTSIKLFVGLINAYLLESHAKGRRAVLIIDEAQNLSADVLEQMRLLTNLETLQRKLLQIILIGQPELLQMVERPELRQLAQRIVARYHLNSLNKKEVAAYIKHRLEVSGAQRQLFPDALIGKLHRLSNGVPRVINVLCDRALLGTFVQGKDRVDHATLSQAAREVFGHQPKPELGMQRALLGGLLLLMAGALAITLYQQNQSAKAGKTVIAQNITTKQVESNIAHKPVIKAQTNSPQASLPQAPTPQAATAANIVSSKLEFPTDAPRTRSRAMAYAALFTAWQASYQEGGDPCRQAIAVGLRCRTARGGLEELREFNVPAVLYLLDDQGQAFYATLIKLDGESATFVTGDQIKKVNIASLATQWTGYYTQLLHLPIDARDSILFGTRGPAMQWLSNQLAQAQGRIVETTANSLFDDALKSNIKQFQLSQGLIPDGAAKPETIARLSALTDQTAPRLFAKQGGK